MIENKSHLTQVRGLKFKSNKITIRIKRSHLTQVRGLKLGNCIQLNHLHIVAPHAGAWIEIFNQ